MTLIPRQQAAGRPVQAFSALIGRHKSVVAGDAGLGLPAVSVASAGDEPSTMAQRILELEDALERERARRQEACDAAFIEGSEKGRAEAESDADERLRLLGEGIVTAAADCAAAIDQRGDVAVTIARTALARILGDVADYPVLVEAIIRHHVAQVSAGSVVGVRVSASDFTDEARLAVLAAEQGGLRIERDSKLAAGSCLFDLTLGMIDASVPLQANAVETLLAPLAFGSGAEQ